MALTKDKGRLPIGKAKTLPAPGVAASKAPKKAVTKAAAKPVAKPEAKTGAVATGEKGTFEGFCVKCKEKNVKFEGEVFEGKTGNRIAKGPHKKCGTTVCRILGKKK